MRTMPRIDVIAALEVLTDRRVHARWEASEGTTPSLDDAVHWLIDDTWLDRRPATSNARRPDLFASADEAQTVQAAVDALDGLMAELGDVPPSEYVRHATWPLVVHRCREALDLLRRG